MISLFLILGVNDTNHLMIKMKSYPSLNTALIIAFYYRVMLSCGVLLTISWITIDTKRRLHTELYLRKSGLSYSGEVCM